MPARATRFPSPLVRAALAACLALPLFAACGGGDDEGVSGDAAAGQAAAPSPVAEGGGQSAGEPEIVRLTERDVEQWIAAMRDLDAVGDRAQGRLGDDPSGARQMVQGLRANAEATAILRRHGFADFERFSRVHYSVISAFVAAQMREGAAEQEEAMREMEAMKGKVPDEQYKAMEAAMKGAAAMREAMGRQPEENVALVARYREQIEGLGGGR
jgi:hypothetical protein